MYGFNEFINGIDSIKEINLERIEQKLWKMFVKQYDPYGLLYKSYQAPKKYKEQKRLQHSYSYIPVFAKKDIRGSQIYKV